MARICSRDRVGLGLRPLQSHAGPQPRDHAQEEAEADVSLYSSRKAIHRSGLRSMFLSGRNSSSTPRSSTPTRMGPFFTIGLPSAAGLPPNLRWKNSWLAMA